MRVFILVVISLLLAITAQAQGYKLTGTLTDADDQSTLISANVVLTSATDTTKWKGALTDIDGKFEFTNVDSGNYKLKVTYVGYASIEWDVRMSRADMEMGVLKLGKNAKQLGDVDVVEKQIRVEQKGDTTEYNSKAFKTNPDATSEDLVTKMPGITKEDGVVKAQGEEVKKVTIDGKDFFGDDASAALKNLPADLVDKVQVFDRMSDQAQFTGFNDGNTTKSMNITTRNGLNGVFGRIYGGYGYLTDSRYSAGATINWFKGDRRFSVIGMSNNVNQQNFASQDLLDITGSQQRGGGRGGAGFGGMGGGRRGGGNWGGGNNNFMVGQTGGIATTHAAGLNYSDVWGKNKRVKITGSYFFNLADNISKNLLSRQYFTTADTSTYYNEDNTTNSRNINHRVNLRLQYDIDSMNSLIFTPRVSIQQNNRQNIISGRTTTAENILLGQTNSNFTSNNLGYNIAGDILYRHKFNKARRTLSVNISPSVNNKNGTSTQLAMNEYADTAASSTLDQQSESSSNTYGVSGNISYTEPAGKTGMVMLSYDGSQTWNLADKRTFNRDSAGSYSLLDTLLSNKYDNQYMTQKGTASYQVSTKKINMNVSVGAQYATLTGSNVFPMAYNTNRWFFNVLPTAMFNYKFTDQSNMRIFYRTATNPPSISQLQNVIDNSNPLLLNTGNPNLRQSYNHFVMVRYGYTNTKKAQSFFVFASANYTQDYIGNSTFIATEDTLLNDAVLLRAGSQLSQPVNLNGSLNTNAFLNYGMPITKIKSNINFNAGFSYNRTPSLINNAQNLANTYNVNGGIALSSNISEKIDFNISYRGTYDIVKNSLQKNSDNNYFNHTAGAAFNWMFWKGFVFNTTLNNTFYTGISQGFNQNIFLWNAALGYKFLKDKSLELRASVNDILNQNNGISRNVTDTYIEDSQNQVLKRYYLVTLTYTLKFYKKDKTPKKGE